LTHWNTVKLEEIATVSGASARNETNLPVYSVTKHRGFVPSLEYFNKQVFSRELGTYTVVEPGEFAYATIHLDEGSVGVCPERCLISPMYTAFRVTSAQMHPTFLIRYLKSPRALAEYPRLGKGSVERRRAISFERLGKIEIPLPPVAEQRRIAEVLERVEALRAKRRAALTQLDILSHSIFLDLFGDPATNPKGWEMLRLQDVLSMPLRNGLSPSHIGKVTAKVLTLSAVTGSEFDDSAWKVSTFRSPPPSDQSVDENDFLICRGNGNVRLVGKGYFPTHRMPDITFPDTMIAARVRTDRLERVFLQHVWGWNAVRRQVESLARTTNGTFKVNQTMLEGITFIGPPLQLQREFARRVGAADKLKTAQRTSLAELDALFAVLQHRAFRGEL
jgi:type I restriction enzyme S subunit